VQTNEQSQYPKYFKQSLASSCSLSLYTPFGLDNWQRSPLSVRFCSLPLPIPGSLHFNPLPQSPNRVLTKLLSLLPPQGQYFTICLRYTRLHNKEIKEKLTLDAFSSAVVDIPLHMQISSKARFLLILLPQPCLKS